MFLFFYCNRRSFAGLQLYFKSYANHLFLCYDCFLPHTSISCISRDRELNAGKLWHTTVLIYIENAWFVIMAIDRCFVTVILKIDFLAPTIFVKFCYHYCVSMVANSMKLYSSRIFFTSYCNLFLYSAFIHT